jgi:ribosomal protein S26
MSNRGRERQVICVKCGRSVRRDKAVVLEKMVFANPLERKDVIVDEYSRGTFREVWYCPSCGKHGRIYEKKKKLLARQRERAQMLEARRAAYRPRPRPAEHQAARGELDVDFKVTNDDEPAKAQVAEAPAEDKAETA